MLDIWKRWLGKKIRRAAGVDDATAGLDRRMASLVGELNRRLDRIEHARWNNPPWHVENASEPNVQLHFPDFLKPGDVAFDVGANTGQLTQVMSRRVGPQGVVVAFEANPAVLQQLTANIVSNAHFNCYLYHAAVMERSNEWFRIIEAGAASAVRGDADGGVRSIALDDFVESHSLLPSLVKIDIEGAEIHALRGFARTIAAHHPTIIFEHNVANDEALTFLRAAGYEAFCTAQHTAIYSSADCLPGRYRA